VDPEMALQSAYRAGKFLGCLSWHLQQASLNPCSWILANCQQDFDELLCAVRGTLTAVIAQDRLTTALADAWNELNPLEFLSEHHCQELESTNLSIQLSLVPEIRPEQFAEIRRDACSSFRRPVDGFVNHIRNLIESAFTTDPDRSDILIRGFRFGEFVSQALYSPRVPEFMYDDEEIEDEEIEHGASPWFDKIQRIDMEPPRYTANRFLEPGSICPPRRWFKLLKTRWGEFHFDESLSDKDSKGPYTPTQLKELTETIDERFLDRAQRMEAPFQIVLDGNKREARIIIEGDPVPISVDYKAALFAEQVRQAYGWVKMSELARKYPELDGQKPQRLLGKLPEVVAQHYESTVGANGGTRFKTNAG
jgi:hypothetical protein